MMKKGKGNAIFAAEKYVSIAKMMVVYVSTLIRLRTVK